MDDAIIAMVPLAIGWLLDLILADPIWLPHPVVLLGKVIAICERRFNRGKYRRLKGCVCSLTLVISTFFITACLLSAIGNIWINISVQTVLIFYCLAGTTLLREVRQVFIALDRSLEDGRKQVGRIVGRDTSELTSQEIRTAALETLAENLSDGVIAPLFWYLILGVPGMMAYKMVNTLDSMIGYRNDRYFKFGFFAAKIDDVANYIPARLTSFLMLVAAGRLNLLSFVRINGSKHLSPNSGYPEASLAGILDCRFGGPHNYFGETVDKPFIGTNQRILSFVDMSRGLIINRRTEIIAVISVLIIKGMVGYLGPISYL